MKKKEKNMITTKKNQIQQTQVYHSLYDKSLSSRLVSWLVLLKNESPTDRRLFPLPYCIISRQFIFKDSNSLSSLSTIVILFLIRNCSVACSPTSEFICRGLFFGSSVSCFWFAFFFEKLFSLEKTDALCEFQDRIRLKVFH